MKKDYDLNCQFFSFLNNFWIMIPNISGFLKFWSKAKLQFSTSSMGAVLIATFSGVPPKSWTIYCLTDSEKRSFFALQVSLGITSLWGVVKLSPARKEAEITIIIADFLVIKHDTLLFFEKLKARALAWARFFPIKVYIFAKKRQMYWNFSCFQINSISAHK